MMQEKKINIIRLLVEYGFLSYGVFFLGWSPLFLLFGFWLEGFIRLFFTDVLVLVSPGVGKLKFIFSHSFIFLFAQFVHGIFFGILAFAAVAHDPFTLNFVALFVGFDSPEANEYVKLFLGQDRLIQPDIFKKDILYLGVVLVLSHAITTIHEIIRLRQERKEWKEAKVSLSSFSKTHLVIMAAGFLIFFVKQPIALGAIVLVVGFLSDLMMNSKGGIKTIGQFLEAQKKSNRFTGKEEPTPTQKQ